MTEERVTYFMICPYCHTENRDDREACYHCSRDLTMLRVIVNKAKLHYNQALEYAERDRTDDAINELQNTLDLDGTMVNAHVVLGTLYAKKEEFDKAREEWNAALASDHRFLKAHDYLNKAEKAEIVFPVIRRLKNLNIGLAVLAGLFCICWILTWVSMRPGAQDAQTRQLVKAIALLDVNKPDAFKEIEAVGSLKDGSKDVREASARLSQIKNERTRMTLVQAREALAEGAPVLALKLVRPMDAGGDKSLGNDINQIRAQAERQVLAKLDDAAKAAAAGQLDSEKLRQMADQAGQAFEKNSPNRKRVDAIVANAEKVRSQRVLAEARDLAAGDSPIRAIVTPLLRLRDQNQKLAPQINEILNNRLGLEVERAAGEIKAMIEKGQLSDARGRIVELDTLYSDAGVKDADPRLAPLAARIAAAERRKSYNAAIERYNKKDWEAFLSMSQDPGALATDPVELATLEKMRGEAMRQFAAAMYEWMNGQDYKFETGVVDAQTAGRVVENWERVYENLPKSLSYGRAPVMFYAASSYFKLGQADKAKELIEQVRKEHPRSFIQREVKSFVKQYGEQLGIE
ncbi:MAG: tetratricopeptide repeat protein [Candidatus Sumerlaeia bacterium]